MRRYRTEIVIPENRQVTLHLPEELAVGRAIVTIDLSLEDELDDPMQGDGLDPRHDFEWWEEFGDDEGEPDDSWVLSGRLGTLEL